MSIQSTITETRQRFSDVQAFVANQPDAKLLLAPPGKWNCAQQVVHLILSQKATNAAYKVPGFAVGLLYGKSSNGSRSFDEVVADYQRHLANGAKSTKEYEPKLELPLDKQRLIDSYIKAGDTYLDALANKSDRELDTLQVKHPILGKLTLRELAYFTLYHNMHHLKSMQGLVL